MAINAFICLSIFLLLVESIEQTNAKSNRKFITNDLITIIVVSLLHLLGKISGAYFGITSNIDDKTTLTYKLNAYTGCTSRKRKTLRK